MIDQAHKVTLTSRAFRNDQLPLLYKELHDLTGFDMALPMNSGAEAVETAVKAARKWGYKVKGIPDGKAEIIVCANNFHGRTITIVSFSTDEQYRDGFGPFTPGFKIVPFGDAKAVRRRDHAEHLRVPGRADPGRGGHRRAAGRLPAGRPSEACRENNVLFMADEIQSGLGRTGKLFAYMHEGVTPDLVIIGKALSGGFYPVSAVLASQASSRRVQAGRPRQHVRRQSAGLRRSRAPRCGCSSTRRWSSTRPSSGEYFLGKLRAIEEPAGASEVRGLGLWIGIELTRPARPYCEKLKDEGILCKETHEHVIRFAPPLVITRDEIDWAVERIGRA